MPRLPFAELVRRRVVILDGAMGTSIHTYPLDLQRDWWGQENISEILNLSRPDVIQEIHESFLAVGCDAVETNTFGANQIVLAEAGLTERTAEINRIGAQLARRACDKFETPDRPRYVVGSIGPGTKLVSLGNTNWDTMLASYTEQCRGLIAGGVDVLLIETAQDLLQVKCAIDAATDAMSEAGVTLPIMVQMSMDQKGGQSTLLGSEASAITAAIGPFAQVSGLGLNCAFGPTELTETIRYFCQNWPRWVSVLPNAGLPLTIDGKAHFPLGPADFTRTMMRFVEEFGVNIVGGCCGTTPEHIRALCDAIGFRAPKPRQVMERAQISSLSTAEDIRQDSSYLVVAERTNTNGSRQFRRLLQAEDWDELVSMARDEVKDGSHVLDVCVDFVGRNGPEDMRQVVTRFVGQIKPGIPLMLDSTDAAVMEAGLKLCAGRCILNSMNLEDGEERVGMICRLANRYGAAVVAGTIDEDKENAMARTAERKIAIARRLRDLAVGRFGLREQDLLFDPLVLPISTGIEADRRNAMETIEGTRRISRELPNCHTVVGLSNVSFGLKPAARVVLNSVFLHEMREAGLTAAIVHASKILPRNRIGDAQWNAALDLIYDRRREGFDPLMSFVSLFPDSDAAPAAAAPTENLSIEERLKRHIIDGEKRHLIVHLDEAREKYSPLVIINTILLEGMKVVGELFGSGQMQLPFVLQSAETMKASVAHLEKFMEKADGQSKGRIVLATVKGDVHDIGKNLVDIILTNNGYTVFNLGIKQPVHEILRAAIEHRADAIGMSGLLVKSVAVMKENLEEMNARGVNTLVLLGGAALTRDYAEETLAELYHGPLLYCKDAFEGLSAMDNVISGGVESVVAGQRQRAQRRRQMRQESEKKFAHVFEDTSSPVAPPATDNPVPVPPFWGRRVVADLSPRHIFPFINPDALFTGQWGLKKKSLSDTEYADLIEQTAKPVFERLCHRAVGERLIEPRVVYGYYAAQSDGNDLIVYAPEEFAGVASGASRVEPAGTPREIARFTFPRQQGRRRLCISDFFRSRSSGQFDVLGLQLVTIGDRATAAAEELRKNDQYQEYLYLHGLGVETAEALAEFWHKRMRQELGYGSEDSPTMRDLFHQHYRGSRYSFGYPACPELDQRTIIAALLKPADIGVELNENFMLVPEQSTDALVVHHPQAKYFDV